MVKFIAKNKIIHTKRRDNENWPIHTTAKLSEMDREEVKMGDVVSYKGLVSRTGSPKRAVLIKRRTDMTWKDVLLSHSRVNT